MYFQFGLLFFLDILDSNSSYIFLRTRQRRVFRRATRLSCPWKIIQYMYCEEPHNQHFGFIYENRNHSYHIHFSNSFDYVPSHLKKV